MKHAVITAVFGIGMILLLSGCANPDSAGNKEPVSGYSESAVQKKEYDDGAARHIAALYKDIYENALQDGTTGSLEMIRSCVEGLGEKGYAAVDDKNQINMINPQQVEDFCKAVREKVPADLTLIVVTRAGGFLQYDFHTEDGTVAVIREEYQYVDGNLENAGAVSFRADEWQYTEEGWLLFEGKYYSESYHALLSSDVTEHMAIRVAPLPETCRKLNRQYLLPVGYEKNNMFLVDWDETDYGALDFYDLFDRFYPLVYRRSVPYTADDDLNAGAVYQIPADTFEMAVGSYIRIEESILRQKTVYVSEGETYEYRPRGFYESGYVEIPYPEVADYQENSDGTVTLTVNAVYPEENTSRAFTHKTVIRPLADGRFQYVSNQLVYPADGYDAWWYAGRLTKEQWEETYGGETYRDQTYGGWEHISEDGSLLLADEKEKLEKDIITAAGQVGEIYRDAAIEEDLIYGHIVRDFSRAQRDEVVSLLGQAGYVSVADGVNMQNPEALREFYTAYQEKQEAMVTVFDVRTNGIIGACTFLYRDGQLQNCYMQIAWKEGGVPEITSIEIGDIKQIKLTEKGYFIYGYEDMPYHSSLRQYWRAAPLSDKCRELTEQYVYGISYVNYNAFVTNWDSSNAEDILMPCMFEDIYRIDTGKVIQPENGEIPAKVYERIMTTYFPVTTEQVREKCGYHAATDSYPYEMIFSRQYPPFGEVVDYVDNPDGTITLYVDGVWPDYDSDCAFTSQITVEPHDDGSFRYISNRIEKGELEIPTVER